MVHVTTAVAAQGTLSDMAVGVSAWSAVGSLVALLVSAIAVLLLVVRRSDMKVIEKAAVSVDKLVEVVSKFREDLAAVREWIAREYATKGDLRDVWTELSEQDRKIERAREHITERGADRRAIKDSEA